MTAVEENSPTGSRFWLFSSEPCLYARCVAQICPSQPCFAQIHSGRTAALDLEKVSCFIDCVTDSWSKLSSLECIWTCVGLVLGVTLHWSVAWTRRASWIVCFTCWHLFGFSNSQVSIMLGMLFSGEHPCRLQTSMHGQCMVNAWSERRAHVPKPLLRLNLTLQWPPIHADPREFRTAIAIATGLLGDSPRMQRYKRWYWQQCSFIGPLNEVHNVSSDEDVCLEPPSDSHDTPAERRSTPAMQSSH